MKLDPISIQNAKEWESAGFELPAFDREAAKKETLKTPAWIHFGSGNIFRAFLAPLQQTLLNAGKARTGIIGVGGYDFEVIEKAYRPFDNLGLLVILKADGTIQKKVIGSVVETLIADSTGKDWKRLVEVFANPSLQMASFTITEKGYSLASSDGTLSDDVKWDLENGPAAPRNVIGKLTALCYARFKNGAFPLSLVSMDNCSHNGTKLFNAVHAIALKWKEAGLVESAFVDYIDDPKTLAFPWTMIDKITPRPDEAVRGMLEKSGFENTEMIVTEKKSWIAPFVNAEETEYLIIEDAFPNGRPPLQESGVIFTDRETVDRVEKMKVCTCLNPLHTALAIYGCLLGYTSIHKEMCDPQLKALVEKIGYQEGLPVVVNPGIIDPAKFIREVITVRFPNPFMPDTPQRIATDTSQKLGVRFGETVKAYMARADLKATGLVFIPLVYAGWCRYLLGIDDEGNAFTPSPDPLLEKATAFVKGIKLGDTGPFNKNLKELLSDASIFGVDLYSAGLGERVEKYFAELVADKGAIRKTLIKYLG